MVIPRYLFKTSKAYFYFIVPFRCKTNEGKYCKFPFIYEGITHDYCTSIKNSGISWCATEVDQYKNYVYGKWGNCDNNTCNDIGKIY